MPLFEMTTSEFRPLATASLIDLGVRERDDLQRLLLKQIDVLGDELYVLTEEFSDWDDSKRRIDLLAIDLQANLVVIELKRTYDGGHMELQAIRYASMVSAMTFERAIQIHEAFLRQKGELAEEARDRIMTFLNWDEADDEIFAAEVRIILVSEDFGKELTTAVLWLRDKDLDIRCIRLRPYSDGQRRLIDVQQIIPLPEAHEYQVHLKAKEQEEKKLRAERYDVRHKFWEGLIALARKNNTRHANLKPSYHNSINASAGVRGLLFDHVVVKESATVELYIDRGNSTENKSIFDRLLERKTEIESAFGAPLQWERLDKKRACRIKFTIERGGYRSPESEWPEIYSDMVAAMKRLEDSLSPEIANLGL